MDKEAARELVRELTSALEAQDRGELVPTVRKAARLAAIVGDDLTRAIFEIHLDGLGPEAAGTGRVSQLSQIEMNSALELAAKDRMGQGAANGAITAPLVEMERLLSAMRKLPPDARIGAGSERIATVRSRIANRVGTFVNNVIMLLGRMPERSAPPSPAVRSKIFIGHGASPAWKDLREFLKERLKLECVEFNTESQAGNMTVARIAEMLDEACFAFLVATGEDTHANGTVHARENVIHETGLFQAKLGFKTAIVLLEEGCAKFSNIHGVTDIRFPKGNIMAASEEIRRVLEREKIWPRKNPTDTTA